MPYESTLSSRLRNCLSTILELEEALEKSDLGELMRDEFSVLKKVAKRLEDVDVEENDVVRIEKATSQFLLELSKTSALSIPLTNSQQVLQ